MSDTPVFEEVLASNPFTAFPTEYTDRYTPEVARQEGELRGLSKRSEQILNLIAEVEKPTKQLLELRARILRLDDVDA